MIFYSKAADGVENREDISFALHQYILAPSKEYKSKLGALQFSSYIVVHNFTYRQQIAV